MAIIFVYPVIINSIFKTIYLFLKNQCTSVPRTLHYVLVLFIISELYHLPVHVFYHRPVRVGHSPINQAVPPPPACHHLSVFPEQRARLRSRKFTLVPEGSGGGFVEQLTLDQGIILKGPYASVVLAHICALSMGPVLVIHLPGVIAFLHLSTKLYGPKLYGQVCDELKQKKEPLLEKIRNSGV